MSSPLSVACRLIASALVVFAYSVFGQTSFMADGTQYSVVGHLSGDQVQPRSVIGTNGGFIVWQDRFTDEDGWGIAAQKLDGNFNGTLGRFRVNQQGAGDQENPNVALLPNGGVVIVWQGGVGANKDVFARFTSANGAFVTGDVTVNSYTNGLQINPSVSALADGSVVVVWASELQDGSMFGVYGQRFTAAGQKLGSEFLVNQTTIYNQRTPAVTALSSGGFVVSWVTDEPPQVMLNSDNLIVGAVNSINIFARAYDSSANGGNEFRVNTASKVSANPQIAASASGFMIAWSELDTATGGASNSWDIVARGFSNSGLAISDAVMINSFRLGDQYRPVLAGHADSYFILWSSLGRDGDMEGVYGQFVDTAGSKIGAEFKINSIVTDPLIRKNIHPAVSSSPAGKMLVSWSSYTGSTSAFDLQCQRFLVQPAVPIPAAPYVFALSANSLTVTWSELAGYSLQAYLLYIDGSSTPVAVSTNSYTVSGLAASSTHSFRLAFQLADGRISGLSGSASGVTWGADSNGDSLPDDWQKLYWGKDSASWPSASADSDGDGASNYAEFLAGTNPADASSVLKTSVSFSNSQLRLNWSARTGVIYQIQYSTNLINWTNIASPRLAVDSSDSVIISPSSSLGYYRVVLVR